jgi:hypothetical protein
MSNEGLVIATLTESRLGLEQQRLTTPASRSDNEFDPYNRRLSTREEP